MKLGTKKELFLMLAVDIVAYESHTHLHTQLFPVTQKNYFQW